MSGWKHDELLADLAGYLRAPDRMVWTDMQIGPSGSPRPDVFTMQKSYSKPRPLSFEIKVSRSDLRADTTAGKWSSYLKFSDGVVFALPDGLATPADIPERCGLIVRKKEVWRYVRKPTLTPCQPNRDAFMKLLIDGVGRLYSPATPQPRRVDTWKEHKAVRAKFGEAVERAARDLVSVQEHIGRLKDYERTEMERVRAEVKAYKDSEMLRAERETESFRRYRAEITSWLGVDARASTYAIETAINRMKERCNSDARVQQANKRVEVAAATIKQVLSSLEVAA